MNPVTLGIILCVLSQILFSSLFLFSYAMQPLNGSSIFSLRIEATMVALWGFLYFSQNKQNIKSFFACTLGKSLTRWSVTLLGTCILASQLWLFMWAPINGEGLNVAMGYFLFPLAMVFAGKLIWREKLTKLQRLALLLAICGIFNELYQSHAFSWSTLWVVLLYPPYYLSRRIMKIPALLGLTFDLTLISPFVLVYLLSQNTTWHLISNDAKYWILIPLLGIVSALSMVFNIRSSMLLPMKIFGLLSYLEPSLLFILSITLLKAKIPLSAYITYGFIWCALFILAINTFLYPVQKNK